MFWRVEKIVLTLVAPSPPPPPPSTSAQVSLALQRACIEKTLELILSEFK